MCSCKNEKGAEGCNLLLGFPFIAFYGNAIHYGILANGVHI